MNHSVDFCIFNFVFEVKVLAEESSEYLDELLLN